MTVVGPPGRFVRIRDTTLRLDERGPGDAPAVLFVHGGPGQGCADFMAIMGDLLARELRVIGVDQRGTLYSDPLTDDAALTVDDLVADFDELRQQLGVERWTVLGHSIGGRYALRYALRHPDAVEAAIFENPEWDFANSTRAQLTRALPLLDDRPADAARVRELLTGELPRTAAMWQEKRRLLAGLPAIYLHDTSRDLMDLLPPLDPEARARGERHSRLLAEDPMLYRSFLPDLEQLTQPALLLVGEHDPIANEPVLDAFRRAPRGHLEVFERSGHFVHVEEPKRYAEAVTAFMAALDPR
jgi:proline iminopeptidase